MSTIFVILVLKTVIYKSNSDGYRNLDFQNCESLKSEHSELNTDFVNKTPNL